MTQPELGKKIFELRQSLGLTQGELAENCNLSLRTVQRIESDEVTPRSHTIKVLFSSLDYDFYNSPSNLSDETFGKEYLIKIWIEKFIKYGTESFNLKINTMKKLSVLTLMVLLISAGLLITKSDLSAQEIDGWFIAGSQPDSYAIGLDTTVFKDGGSSAFLGSIDKRIDGFGTLMQSCNADEYLGKRIKMTAYIKSEDVSEWAGMWLRVDSKLTKKSLSFDNMQDRPIKGDNDWVKCVIILDVPEESGTLNFGVLLVGKGKVWFDNITFEIVDKLKTKPTKERLVNKKPLNLSFGE